MTFDAIVIGGGVVGLSTAWRLVEGGLKRVMLLEANLLASGGTGLGTGSVHTQRWQKTDTSLIGRSKRLMQEITDRSGGVFRLYPVGRLTLVGKGDVGTVLAYGDYLREAGLDAVELPPDRLTDRFPGLNVSDVGIGLYTKDDGTVYPSALIWAMAGLFRNAGGTIWEGCRASRIVFDGHRTTGVELANGDVVESARVVLASGVWTRKILESSGLGLALKHAVTHNTVVTVGRQDLWSQVPSLLDGVQGVIAIPRNPGTIMASNTAGEYGSDPETAETVLKTAHVEIRKNGTFADETALQQGQVLAQLRHRYRDYDIRSVVGHWAGLLDGTPDSNPYVGPYPGIDGLWVGCGLTGYGVQRGPGVGETLANFAMQQPLAVDVDTYSLDRFAPDLEFEIDMSGDNPFVGFQHEGARA